VIGIFDSGLGGLTVAREVRRRLPEAAFLYLGDTARLPYGSKSKATIIRYALEDAEFLIEHGATILVVACNTVSSVAIPALREQFPTIPLFEVITPAVAAAVRVTQTKRIGVIGTRATMGSGIYEAMIHEQEPKATVAVQACPLLVPLIEEGWQKKPETGLILRRYLSPLKAKTVDTLILGCTHYPLLRTKIQHRMGRGVDLIDPAVETVKKLAAFLASSPSGEWRGPTQRYFFTDVTEKTTELARAWLGESVKLEAAQVGRHD
jgi:glutamate racemase